MSIISRLTFIICVSMPAFAFAADGHGPSLSGLFWRIAVFAVFLAIMIKLLKKRIQTGLGAGVETVIHSVEDAKKACDESENELSEYSRKIAGMNAELENMKQTALKSAEKEAEMMVQDAEKAAAKFK